MHPLQDLFHRLMTASWPATIGFVFVAYVLLNVVFALVYLALGDCIVNARPGRIEDAFFFSVQTMATIGYGVMTPRGTVANLVVSMEAIFGIVAAAVVTGLVFAKFSRPTARLRFSHVAVVGTIDGQRVLSLRLANERNNRLMEASAHVVLLRDEVTREGHRYRRMRDLPLQRDRSAVFALSWTLLHTIDETSLLWGETAESLAQKNASLIVIITGTDEGLLQAVHARKGYDAEAIVFGARFVDVFEEDGQGRVLNLDRIHSYVLEPGEG
jgi:inward rectifier potassium channel